MLKNLRVAFRSKKPLKCLLIADFVQQNGLRWFPSKRSHHRFPMKLGMLMLQGKEIKNVIKRGGHRACFHATMLTSTVIKVTFGDLRAQQISAIIFQCGVL